MPNNSLYDQIIGKINYISKEQYEQLEKHIDELELDISYLNDKCEQQEQEAHNLANMVHDQDKLICDQDKLIKTLEARINNLECYANYVNNRVDELVQRCSYDG